jgi:hypothetical protein
VSRDARKEGGSGVVRGREPGESKQKKKKKKKKMAD